MQIPCFSGICLADNLTEKATSVHWVDYWPQLQKLFVDRSSDVVTLGGPKPPKDSPPAKARIRDTSVTRAAIEFVQSQVKGLPSAEAEKLVLYVASGRADQQVFEMFQQFKPTICRTLQLSAVFQSDSGHPTVVVLQAMSPGDLRAVSITRGFKYNTTDRLSQIETRKSIRAAHPMVFDFRNNPKMPAHFRIDAHIIKATGNNDESEMPSVTYELRPRSGDASAIDIFDNTTQAGCNAKAQSLD
jgi:hypothetical protein